MLFTVFNMYEVLVHDQVVKMLHTKSMTVNDRICQVLNLQNQLFSNKQKNPKKLEPLKPRCCDFFFGMSGHIVVGWLVGWLGCCWKRWKTPQVPLSWWTVAALVVIVAFHWWASLGCPFGRAGDTVLYLQNNRAFSMDVWEAKQRSKLWCISCVMCACVCFVFACTGTCMVCATCVILFLTFYITFTQAFSGFAWACYMFLLCLCV